ncbi:MAG: hypothetical protein OHK0046_09110 [Anaerolineae bacterium]
MILTGYIGTETPILGRQIAERLRMPFVNLDAQIAERLGLTIDDIRAYYGETRLKSIEMEIMQEAALRRSTVLRISGRTLLHADHYARLQTTGPVIALKIGLDAMLHKLHINMGARYHDPRERAMAIGELKREWDVYTLPELIIVDTTSLEAEEIMQRVMTRWQEVAIERL